MDLGEAGIRQCCASLKGTPDRCAVGSLRIRRKVEDVSIAAGSENDSVSHVRFDFPRDQVSSDDAASFAVDDDNVQQFGPGIHLNLAGGHLPQQCLIGAEKELLPRLSARIKRT